MILTNWEFIIHILILLSIIALISIIIYQKYFSNCNMCKCNKCKMNPCQCIMTNRGNRCNKCSKCSRGRNCMCSIYNKFYNNENNENNENNIEKFTTTDSQTITQSSESKLYNDVSNNINDLYDSNYNAIKNFLDNQINIDDMIERVTKINNKLETNLNKKTKINANGDIEFY